jgi:hypothetical protein
MVSVRTSVSGYLNSSQSRQGAGTGYAFHTRLSLESANEKIQLMGHDPIGVLWVQSFRDTL